MRQLRIGSAELTVKDYHCAGPDGVYIPKDSPKLWLYIHLTNRCNARCPFCVNPSANGAGREISLPALRDTLEKIRDAVGGVSITGGEPMLVPELVDETALAVTEILGREIQLELVTNGTNLPEIGALKTQSRFSAIHISRHLVGDAANGALMGVRTPSWPRLRAFLSELDDPAGIVLNCVLQKGGVDSVEAVRSYLEMAAWAGVKNVSFIGMFRANDYCRERYVSPEVLDFADAPGFAVWNRFRDHDCCSCSGGDYRSENGYIRYYFRCPGAGRAEYVRQLVYDSDDRLLAGFGGGQILL